MKNNYMDRCCYGLSFLSLLYLQMFAEEMVKMRNGHNLMTGEGALMAASKEAESAEVALVIEDILRQKRRRGNNRRSSSGVMRTSGCDDSSDGSVRSSRTENPSTSSELPRAMISRKHGSKTILRSRQ